MGRILLFPIIGAFQCAVLLIGLGLFALWIWMIIDCATKEEEGTNKVVWILVVVLANWIGALIYLFARKIPRDRAASGFPGVP